MRNERFFGALIGCILCLSLASCRAQKGQEPEQGALVCAIGVDPDPAGVRLSLEILVPREGSGSELRVLSAAGETAASAFDAARGDFPRELLFGHCAIFVFGDGISDTVLSGLLTDEALPPEMQAVTAPDARTLLCAGGQSAPAAGYDLQSILAGTPGVRCRVYELLRDGSGRISADRLPHFEVAPKESGKRFALRIPQGGSQQTGEGGD